MDFVGRYEEMVERKVIGLEVFALRIGKCDQGGQA